MLLRLCVLLLVSPVQAAEPGEPQPSASVRMGATFDGAWVPPFRQQARDRLTAQLQATLQVDPRLGLGLHVDGWRVDQGSSGTVSGAGDIQLHTWARLWTGPVSGGAAWWVKLPNADDRNELGTDETDVHVAATFGSDRGPASLRAWVGLASLGDPFSATARELLPEGEARLGWALGPVELVGRMGATPAGPEPRPVGSLGLGVEARCPLLLGVEGRQGLTGFGPQPGLRGWLGWASGCARERDEEPPCCDGPLPGQ